MNHVIKNPPAIKQHVATKEGHCKLASPEIAWPEVQPPAYRVPKPTIKPPITIIIKPRKVISAEKLNTSCGFILWLLC